mgnify:CR=1 FL=1
MYFAISALLHRLGVINHFHIRSVIFLHPELLSVSAPFGNGFEMCA